MKTLVIHPIDSTTDFLTKIYYNKNYTVVRERISNSALIDLIRQNDRIIMLGHGTSLGLLSGENFILTSKHVQFLRDKICIGIWCYANEFFIKYGLKGFYTGMFISEIDEAYYEGFRLISEKDIEYSNDLFSKSISANIDSNNILDDIRTSYNDKYNIILQYNRNLLGFQS